MKFDIYGRFVIEVVREQGQWAAYRHGQGIRRREEGIVIPPELEPNAIARYLDDIYHELAGPDDDIGILARDRGGFRCITPIDHTGSGALNVIKDSCRRNNPPTNV